MIESTVLLCVLSSPQAPIAMAATQNGTITPATRTASEHKRHEAAERDDAGRRPDRPDFSLFLPQGWDHVPEFFPSGRLKTSQLRNQDFGQALAEPPVTRRP